MSIFGDMYPGYGDFLYEEEAFRNPSSVRAWTAYLHVHSGSPFWKRAVLYERAIKVVPGSYKIWSSYLREMLKHVRDLPITHPLYDKLNNTFERALVTMHKMPRIWIMYLHCLMEQKLLTRTRRTFDRALGALSVTQHDRIWGPYLDFVSQPGIPIETSLRVHRRYLNYDPSHAEDFIQFLLDSCLWQEAAKRLAALLNNDKFSSVKGKTKHTLWLELCELLSEHATEVFGLNVDAIIRGGIKNFTDEVSHLWTALAEYYVRRKLPEKARDVFEEGMTTVVTVRDFSVIFDAYWQFEEIMLALEMDSHDWGNEEEGDVDGLTQDEEDIRNDLEMPIAEFKKLLFHGYWLHDENDADLRLTRLQHLTERRPLLVNSILLRQNPHNVEQWHQRVRLFEGDATRQIMTYVDALRTVDPMKAVGKPHTLWIAFAKLYENNKDLGNARAVFGMAARVNFKSMDHLAIIVCEWAEMELRHKNFNGALALMRWATAIPAAGVKRTVAADPEDLKGHFQGKLYTSCRIWAFYVDLEESIGSLESVRVVYERILELKIATPQIIINYAVLLEEHNYYEDAFQVYEVGVTIFKYPHAKDIWVTYLAKFVKKYGKMKLERARDLFERAVKSAPAEFLKPLFLQYAKLEEDYGLANRAIKVYHKATEAVPSTEKLSMFEIYIAHVWDIYGVSETRKTYEQAIQAGLPEKDVKAMCLKYAELEERLGEIDRARAIYAYASQLAHPCVDPDFWNLWHEFELKNGNEQTFRGMLRTKRSISASSQSCVLLPECLMHKEKKAGLGQDETDTHKNKLTPVVLETPANDDRMSLPGFVSFGVLSEEVRRKMAGNSEDIKFPDRSESEDEDMLDLKQMDVPAGVSRGLIRKREQCEEEEKAKDDTETKGKDTPFGALNRLKRRRRG